jgi:glycerol uptake facilitator-like aquaporin
LSVPLSKRLLAAVIGTFGLFFTRFCGIAALSTQGPGAILSIGLALMIFAFGQISGGHFNAASSAR